MGRMTLVTANKIKQQIIDGLCDEEIAKENYCLEQAVYAIRTGRTWNNGNHVPIEETSEVKFANIPENLASMFGLKVHALPPAQYIRFVEGKANNPHHSQTSRNKRSAFGSSLNPTVLLNSYTPARAAPNLFS